MPVTSEYHCRQCLERVIIIATTTWNRQLASQTLPVTRKECCNHCIEHVLNISDNPETSAQHFRQSCNITDTRCLEHGTRIATSHISNSTWHMLQTTFHMRLTLHVVGANQSKSTYHS
jgi:hypothetical protein